MRLKNTETPAELITDWRNLDVGTYFLCNSGCVNLVCCCDDEDIGTTGLTYWNAHDEDQPNIADEEVMRSTIVSRLLTKDELEF